MPKIMIKATTVTKYSLSTIASIGVITATIPRIKVELVMIDPNKFPRNIVGSLSSRDLTEKASSGKVVPIDKRISPTIKTGMPAISAKRLANLTTKEAETRRSTIPIKSRVISFLRLPSTWVNIT